MMSHPVGIVRYTSTGEIPPKKEGGNYGILFNAL